MKLQASSPNLAQRAAVRLRHLVVLVLACLCTVACVSAQVDESQKTAPRPTGETTGKQCEWACERWTKMCNVDPRGVYKCQRTCAKFGEVCEE